MPLWDFLRRRNVQVELASKDNIVSEKKGQVGRRTYDQLVPHPANLSDFIYYYNNDDEVHAAVNALTDMSVGGGYYTGCEENERAKEIVDKWAAFIGLDQQLLNIVKTQLIFGFCPVERWFVRGPPKGAMKIKLLPPRTVWYKRTKQGGHLGYQQKFYDASTPVDFKPEEIVWFVYNQVGTSPYGTSICASILKLLKAKKQVHEDMPKIIHRYASPLTVWKYRQDISEIKDAVSGRTPNEDIFLGHLNKDAFEFDTVQMDPRGRFENYIEQIDMGIMEGLQAPILRYMRNATEASATKMLEVIDRHIAGIQRYVKRVVETEFFAMVLKRHGILDVPTLNWGAPKTGLEDLDLQGIANLVKSNAVSSRQAQKLLIKMGLPLEEEDEENEFSG